MTVDIAKAPERTAPKPPSWWRRPWMIPLALVTLAWWILTARPFRELDEATAPLPPHDDYALYWPSLVAHMGFGTITMFTLVLQVWPWLRRNHPRVHRIGGRVHVVSGLITGMIALSVIPWAMGNGKVGVTVSTVCWLFFLTMGFIRARQRRFAQHRRFMLYSFAIAMNTVLGTFIIRLGLKLPFEKDMTYMSYLLEAGRWGWVLNLMLVQAWLYHKDMRPEPLPV